MAKEVKVFQWVTWEAGQACCNDSEMGEKVITPLMTMS